MIDLAPKMNGVGIIAPAAAPGILVKVHKIVRRHDPFGLQLHDRYMGSPHLVIVFEEHSPLRRSEHHVDF